MVSLGPGIYRLRKSRQEISFYTSAIKEGERHNEIEKQVFPQKVTDVPDRK